MESKCKVAPVEISSVKQGNYIIMNKRPCKVTKITLSKTGKHGHMKAHVVGRDVFTATNEELRLAGHLNVMSFELGKSINQLININDDYLECMDEKNKECSFKIDKDSQMFKDISRDFAAGKTLNITVLRAPIQTGEDKFDDREIVESFKEQQN